MGDLSTIGRMHFIIDGSGNYYRVNANDQLVVAGSRDEADVFSFIEANKRIGGGKKAHFYSAIPVENEAGIGGGVHDLTEPEDTPEMENTAEEKDGIMTETNPVEQNTHAAYSYDLSEIDWKEYLTHFCYVVSTLKDYQDSLTQALSEADMEICDILHYIELYELSQEDELYVMNLLRECRDHRRSVKDEMYRTECFQRALGGSSNVAKAKDNIKLIEKLGTRKYKPRKLAKLFETGIKRERQEGKAFVEEIKEAQREAGAEESMEDINKYNVEDIQVLVRKETMFDHQRMDWKQFVRSQLDFYKNVEQYMFNLKCDLKDIEASIEEILTQIETANCNVAQGYKFFKWLKELRNAKKEKEEEMECLMAMTECFDCPSMVRAYEYALECVEEVVGQDEVTEEVYEPVI